MIYYGYTQIDDPLMISYISEMCNTKIEYNFRFEIGEIDKVIEYLCDIDDIFISTQTFYKLYKHPLISKKVETYFLQIKNRFKKLIKNNFNNCKLLDGGYKKSVKLIPNEIDMLTWSPTYQLSLKNTEHHKEIYEYGNVKNKNTFFIECDSLNQLDTIKNFCNKKDILYRQFPYYLNC